MAIIKRAKNININVKGTYTSICSRFEERAESITITSTKENLVLSSNKKIIVQGNSGGVIFGDYTSPSPEIINISWMDENQENIIEELNLNQTVFLIVETEEKKEGLEVSISVDNPNDTEVILNGVTDKDGIARIKWVYI